MFRVITLNANGIRAAARKGFFDWLAGQDADVVCIQETKAQEHQLSDGVFCPDGYHCFYEDAEKKGYSGVAIYTRHEPKRIVRGYGDPEFDRESRNPALPFTDNVAVSQHGNVFEIVFQGAFADLEIFDIDTSNLEGDARRAARVPAQQQAHQCAYVHGAHTMHEARAVVKAEEGPPLGLGGGARAFRKALSKGSGVPAFVLYSVTQICTPHGGFVLLQLLIQDALEGR